MAANQIEDALAVFLRLGFFVGEDTPFRAIRAVPPDATFEWEGGQLQVSGRYVYGPPSSLNRDDALDAYIQLFREAVEKRLPADAEVALPLSGGRDSRHILLELCHLGRPPRVCVTIPRYPPAAAEDERISSMLAVEVGVTHHLLRQPPRVATAELRKNWLTHLCADEHTWYLPLIDWLEQQDVVVFDGMGGALSVASRFLSPRNLSLFERGRFEELADCILDASSVVNEQFLEKVLSMNYRVKLGRERARRRLADDLSRHANAPDPAKSLNFWNRTRREIALAPYALMNRVRSVVSPYLDHDVYDLLSSLPPAILSSDLTSTDKSFHSDAIRRAHPRYAHVPFEKTHGPATDARQHYSEFAASVARFIVTNTRRSFRLLDNKYAWSRLAMSLVSRRFREGRGWLPPVLLYLWQVDHAELAAESLSASSDSSVARPHS